MRSAARTASRRSIGVSSKNLIDDAFGCPFEVGQSSCIEGVGDHDEPVAMEEFGSAFDLVRCAYLEIGNPVVQPQGFSQSCDAWIVTTTLPAHAGRVSGSEVAVLGGGFDAGIQVGCCQPIRIVIACGSTARPIHEAIRRHRRIPPDGRCHDDDSVSRSSAVLGRRSIAHHASRNRRGVHSPHLRVRVR